MNKLGIFFLMVFCAVIGALAAGLGVFFSAKADDAETLSAECVLVSPGNVAGTIYFNQENGEKIVITGNVTALIAGNHGFHIHEFGIVDNDCDSAGGHFNPYDVNHGAPTDETHHVGDMGNILTQSSTHPTIIDERDLDVSLFEPDSIIGRGLVIHVGEDDFVTQPTGDAGGRAACCTVMVANPDYS